MKVLWSAKMLRSTSSAKKVYLLTGHTKLKKFKHKHLTKTKAKDIYIQRIRYNLKRKLFTEDEPTYESQCSHSTIKYKRYITYTINLYTKQLEIRIFVSIYSYIKAKSYDYKS